MADTEDRTLEEVIGENLRRIREDEGWSQDDLARRARAKGLPWSRSSVAAVEAGTKTLDLSEVLLLRLAVSGNFDQLLAGKGFVVLGRGARIPLGGVRSLLADQDDQVRIKVDIQTPDLANLSSTAEVVAGFQSLKRRVAKLAPGASAKDLMSAERAASGEAEQKAARKLSVSAVDLAVAAFGLWGRSLTEERDGRVKDWPKPPQTPRAVTAVRGHVTRQLLAELEPILKEA